MGLEYRLITHRLREMVRSTVPVGATVMVVSKGDDELLQLDGRASWHFPRAVDGTYAGYFPADSAEAIAHLETLRAEGGAFLVFPSTAFWWLDHYSDFRQYLESCYRIVHREDACVIFELGEPNSQGRTPSHRSRPSIHHAGITSGRG